MQCEVPHLAKSGTLERHMMAEALTTTPLAEDPWPGLVLREDRGLGASFAIWCREQMPDPGGGAQGQEGSVAGTLQFPREISPACRKSLWPRSAVRKAAARSVHSTLPLFLYQVGSDAVSFRPAKFTRTPKPPSRPLNHGSDF